jgi:hypothetical protein
VKKHELKIALRAAARVTHQREFFIIGSQAIHGHCQRPPAEVLLSQDCDLYPRAQPQAAQVLARELGRNSVFARKHGFYVDVVTPEIASLPEGWEKRLKPFRVGVVTGYCLELHDLLAGKLAAGRLKDLELAAAMIKLHLVRISTLRARVARLFPASAVEYALSSLTSVLTELKKSSIHRKSYREGEHG